MESESTEIDFRSLEDELYDNEITQILSQPNTAESMYMYKQTNKYLFCFLLHRYQSWGGGCLPPPKK